MKILVIARKTNNPSSQQKFEALARSPAVQVRVLAPSLLRDFVEGFRFYPDIIWVDEEPYCLAVTQWIVLKKILMPWSHVVSTARDNFFRQFPRFRRQIERFNYRNLTAVLSTGKTTTDNLLRKGFAGKILEVSGLDSGRPAGEIRGEQDAGRLKEALGLQFKVVGYAGPLRPEKGLEWLIRSVAKLPLNLELLFVGSGPSEFPLKQLAAELGMESRLKIVPDGESSGFLKYDKAMDVLVLPALSTISWREPFNEVLLEAMRVGLPVIASRSGEIPYELGDAGIVIPEGDEKALAEALTKLLGDDAFRAQVIEKEKAHAGEFKPEKIIQSVVGFFSTILK